MNLFRKSTGEKSIFKNEEALLPSFLPDDLPGRQRELRELVYCLTPASENKQPEHALLIGPPGTGKTSSAKFVLKQLSEYSQRPLPIYINCWEYNTRFAVLSFLCVAIGEPMPRRGVAADEIFSRFLEICKKEERIPIIVLDEVDRLAASQEGLQVLYDLTRCGEIHNLKTGLVAITNDEGFHTKLDARVHSSFVQHTLKFEPYSVVQLKEILQDRALLSFMPGALDSEVVPLCAAISFKRGGDARVALSLLLSSGKAAERDNAAQVRVEHVRKVEAQTLQQSGVKAERKKDELDEVDGKILELVKKEGKAGLSSSKLYESLSKYGKDRSLRGRVDRLEKLGILITEDVQLKVGRSRVIRVKEQP